MTCFVRNYSLCNGAIAAARLNRKWLLLGTHERSHHSLCIRLDEYRPLRRPKKHSTGHLFKQDLPRQPLNGSVTTNVMWSKLPKKGIVKSPLATDADEKSTSKADTNSENNPERGVNACFGKELVLPFLRCVLCVAYAY